jgi:hypothetical protein
MMSAPALTSPALRYLTLRAEATRPRARLLAAHLAPAQLIWRPMPRAWSIGECLEHLVVIAEEFYLQMRPALYRALESRPVTAAGAAADSWRPSLAGRLILKALDPMARRRVRSPQIFLPSPVPRPALLDAFLLAQEELIGMMQMADGLDLTRVRLHSPANSCIRIHLGDAFEMLICHAERHLGQAERVAVEVAFPRRMDLIHRGDHDDVAPYRASIAGTGLPVLRDPGTDVHYQQPRMNTDRSDRILATAAAVKRCCCLQSIFRSPIGDSGVEFGWEQSVFVRGQSS